MKWKFKVLTAVIMINYILTEISEEHVASILRFLE
jgi:hypothetical protein